MKENQEVRLGSMTLALAAITCAAILIKPELSTDVLAGIDDAYERVLAAMLGLSGIMQAVGAYLVIRRVRQLGLVFSTIGLVALAGSLASIWMPYAAVAALLAIASVYCLFRDVHGKPRNKCLIR